MQDILIVVLFSYFIGSIPFGLILTKFFTTQDVRKIGSGNIGATNVLRTGNKYLALATLLLDILKGYIPVIVTIEFYPDLIELSCLTVFLAHIFPVWIKFKGGKGVATYLGILFALSLQLSSLFIFTWLVISLIFRYASLSSMIATFTVFVINTIREIAGSVIPQIPEQNFISNLLSINLTLLLFIFLVLIIFTHRKNISNLKNKTEQKIRI